jgi:hypothetical protein
MTLDLSNLQAQLITVENRQTVLSPKDLFGAIWSVKYQVAYHYNRSAWVLNKIARPGMVVPLPTGMKPPTGSWNVILLDDADQEGALGYHDDEAGTKIPFAEVFCRTSQQDGVQPAEVLSHEILEMLVDPTVEDVRPYVELNPVNDMFYIVEVGDPVQGCGYDIGAPEGRTCGVIVADFALPAWWRLPNPAASALGPFSFRHSVSKAYELAPAGYMSVYPKGTNEEWKQIYGQDTAAAGKAAARDSKHMSYHGA